MQVKVLGAKLMLVALLMLANIVISASLANLTFWIRRRYRVRERVRNGHEQEGGQPIEEMVVEIRCHQFAHGELGAAGCGREDSTIRSGLAAATL